MAQWDVSNGGRGGAECEVPNGIEGRAGRSKVFDVGESMEEHCFRPICGDPAEKVGALLYLFFGFVIVWPCSKRVVGYPGALDLVAGSVGFYLSGLVNLFIWHGILMVYTILLWCCAM